MSIQKRKRKCLHFNTFSAEKYRNEFLKFKPDVSVRYIYRIAGHEHFLYIYRNR